MIGKYRARMKKAGLALIHPVGFRSVATTFPIPRFSPSEHREEGTRKKCMREKNMQFMRRPQREGDQAVSQTDLLYSIEDIGRVKLPSTGNATTNGDRLQTMEDIGTVRLPSPRLNFPWTEAEGVEPLARAPAVHDGQSEEQTLSKPALEKLAAQRASPSRLPRPRVKRRRLLLVMNIILLMTLIFALVRLTSILSATDDQLRFSLGSQGTALVDLRQSSTISPYLFGANVFPKMARSSVDQRYSGFMNYSPPITSGLRNAH